MKFGKIFLLLLIITVAFLTLKSIRQLVYLSFTLLSLKAVWILIVLLFLVTSIKKQIESTTEQK